MRTHVQHLRGLSSNRDLNIRSRTGEIKECQIGVEVYARGEGFDPKLDNIVRVEANRRRAKLREYYENGGRSNPVRVDIPRGAYLRYFV